MGRVRALLFHDLGARREWVVSSTPRPQFNPKKTRYYIAQETGCVPGPVWRSAGNLDPTGIRSPDLQARSQYLNRLSYPTHAHVSYFWLICLRPANVYVSQSTRYVARDGNNMPYWCERKVGMNGVQYSIKKHCRYEWHGEVIGKVHKSYDVHWRNCTQLQAVISSIRDSPKIYYATLSLSC
jgi:hypothetical protein